VPLGEGALCGRIASSPVHAYEFDVTNRNCLTESAYRVERFEVHVEGDDILLSEEPAQG
jgi:nitrite reductase (NADH) small subunit